MQPMSAPEVRWGEWIGEGWQMFVNQWLNWVLIILAFFALIMVPVIPIYIVMVILVGVTAEAGGGDAAPLLVFPLFAIMAVVLVLASSYLMSGAYKTAFKQMRGETIAVGDLFSGGDVFLRVAGAVLLMGLVVAIGGLLCLIPGLIAAGLLYFTVPLIIERNMGVIEAMQTSFERTKGNWLMFTLFALVVQFLASLGQLACGVGILASYPLLFTISAVAFRDTFGLSGARQFIGEQQMPPPPSAYTPQSWAQPSSAPPPQPGFQPPPPAPPQPGEAAVVCPRCGSRAASGTAKFCNVCGTNLRG
ncbi:MAG: hypothetical protein KIT57_24155 [Blastocatellales bacterium]|nr:hypothetical protein [Blastocatellales bacterium]